MADSKVTVYTLTHTLTVTCACCCDIVKGTQDLKMCSHADVPILPLCVFAAAVCLLAIL
jgi:hypothetical protein